MWRRKTLEKEPLKRLKADQKKAMILWVMFHRTYILQVIYLLLFLLCYLCIYFFIMPFFFSFSGFIIVLRYKIQILVLVKWNVLSELDSWQQWPVWTSNWPTRRLVVESQAGWLQDLFFICLLCNWLELEPRSSTHRADVLLKDFWLVMWAWFQNSALTPRLVCIALIKTI